MREGEPNCPVKRICEALKSFEDPIKGFHQIIDETGDLPEPLEENADAVELCGNTYLNCQMRRLTMASMSTQKVPEINPN